MDTDKITTIKLKKNTKSLLDNLKIIERESYDEVIKRLIQSLPKEQPEAGFREQAEPEFKSKEIVPAPIQEVKKERAKLLRSILGSVEDNRKEEEKESKVKISSRFKYP